MVKMPTFPHQPPFLKGFRGLAHRGRDFGYLRYGMQTYWVRGPLIYLENNIDQGAVVARRLLNQVGMEYNFSNRIELPLHSRNRPSVVSEVPVYLEMGLGSVTYKAVSTVSSSECFL